MNSASRRRPDKRRALRLEDTERVENCNNVRVTTYTVPVNSNRTWRHVSEILPVVFAEILEAGKKTELNR